MPEKVFLTGANGLLGSFILKYLLSKDYEVKALKRKNSDTSLIDEVKDNVDWVEGDILDFPLLEEATKDCQVIIHAAAIVSFDPSEKKKMMKTNVDGTKNLVDLALIYQIPYFIHISSVAAVGRPKLDNKPNENTQWEDNKYISNYARSKYNSEIEVWRGIAEGLNASILNPSFIIGPGNFNKSSTRVFKYVWDEKPFYAKGLINYVDVRDVIFSINVLLEKRISGERFILNGGNVTYKDFFERVAKRWHKKPPKIAVGPVLSAIAWRYEAIKSFITGKAPLITKETAKTSRKEFIFDARKSLKILDVKYFSLDESLDWVCDKLKPQ